MLPIGEVAKRAGIAASALRYYEREGLIPAAARAGGRRVYDPEVLDRLALVRAAKQAGFTIAEIRDFLRGVAGRSRKGRAPGPRFRKLAARKLAELEARQRELDAMRRALEAATGCACPTLEDCAAAIREAGA